MRRLRLAAAALLAGGLLVACSDDVPPVPEPPTTLATTSTTSAPDLSNLELRPVPGSSTTTVVLGPGQANLAGAITGPDGAVGGAQVLIERLAGDGMASTQVTAGPDGRFSAPRVLGGRYRIRAWRAPDLALTDPAIFFLEAKETKDVPLTVRRFAGIVAVASVAPDPPIVRKPTGLAVAVATRTVDDGGIVRSQPISGVRLELFGGDSWKVLSANPVTADGSGRGRWEVQCDEVGRAPLSVVVASDAAIPLDLPACALTPPTTTTTAPPGGDGAGGDGGRTTTTSRSTSTTTRSSTTTRPRP